MITNTEAASILTTIASVKKKRFQLVDFETNEHGLMIQFRSNLSHPEHAGRWFAKFGLEASPRLLENDGVFTLWLRKAVESV